MEISTNYPKNYFYKKLMNIVFGYIKWKQLEINFKYIQTYIKNLQINLLFMMKQ